MIALLILLGYLAGALITGRIVFVRVLGDCYGLSLYEDEAKMTSTMCAIFWPIVMVAAPFMLFKHFLFAPTPSEKRAIREGELKERAKEIESKEQELIRWAKQNNFDYSVLDK